ncbi:hypothetical protein AMECASPLE_031578 [Ameca splendens]|uniref:Uncharacterized protein n=1 Tax=Ameca splendens TaxID=208324 RepID=A0ABV0XJ92_9TELE
MQALDTRVGLSCHRAQQRFVWFAGVFSPFSLLPVECNRQKQQHSCFPPGLIKDSVHKELEPGRRRQIVYSPSVIRP